jgi:mannose-6-phosphate isomerase-like protein (cupin superfamily)
MNVWESMVADGGVASVLRQPAWRTIGDGVEIGAIDDERLGRCVIWCRIAAGALLAEHRLPMDGVTFVMQGSGEMTLPGSLPLPFRAGDSLLVRAQVPHAVRAGDTTALVLGTALVA